MSKTKPKTELLTATMANEPLPTCPVAAIKRYDENFRKSAVEHWIKTGQPGTQIATELGISYPSLKEWKRRYHGDALPHSDRGVQYASAEHRQMLAAAGLQPSMSRAGNPYDNAAMESFMATYKRECVGLAQAAGGYATRAAAAQDFFEYAEAYYNRERSHSALGYQSPVDFETQLN
jgi:transposase-like protein